MMKKFGQFINGKFFEAVEDFRLNGVNYTSRSAEWMQRHLPIVEDDADFKNSIYYDVETKHELKDGYIREYYVGTLKPSAEVGQLGNDKAKALIAEKYSQSAESKLLRKAIADPKANAAEFAKYNAYVEQCIATADAEVEALLPVVESKPRKVEQPSI